MTDISILFATHNGADVLPRTLQAYAGLKDPGFSWQLFIVDNASSDATHDILRDFSSRIPLTVIAESTPGKNRALNRGLASIRSDAIVLSDDDALPEPNFLTAWHKAFGDNPTADIFGASIEPIFDVEIPDWMRIHKPRFAELYALRDGLPAGTLDGDEVYGPNMAVHRRVFDRGITFNEDIGPNGSLKNYAMGSETEFCKRAEANGCSIVFAPEPKVFHIVRAHQTSETFIGGRAYRLGLGSARKAWLSGQTVPRSGLGVRATARYIRRNLHASLLRLRTVFPGDLQRFHATWNYHFFKGYEDEVARLRAEFRQHENPRLGGHRS